jgi:outer membrane protein TolC
MSSCCAAPIALGIGLVLAGCATSSTAGDRDRVSTLVEQRADLDLVERDPERFEQPEPDAARLLAQPLTAESAVRIAVLNNRELRAELHELGIARGALVQASALPNPELEAQVLFPEDSAQGDRQWELGVGFDITRALLAPQRSAVAAAEVEATRCRVAGSVLDLSYSVQLAFRTLQARQQQLELQKTSLQALGASRDVARALREAGNLPAIDAVSEQAAYEQARIAVAEAEADLLDAREQLNVMLGVFGEATAWRLEDRLPDPPERTAPLERLETRAIEASLELLETRAQLTAQARRVGLSESEGWLPDLRAGVQAERDGDSWSIGPKISGTLPLFDRRRGDVQTLEARFWALRERYVATALSVRAGVRAARNRLQSAEERARHYRGVILPLRERVVAETVLQYNAMQVGVFQLLQARRDQVDAARAYIATLLEYWHARAALDQLLSGRLTGTLEQVVTTRSRAAATTASAGAHD